MSSHAAESCEGPDLTNRHLVGTARVVAERYSSSRRINDNVFNAAAECPHAGRKSTAVWTNPTDIAIVPHMHYWYARIEHPRLSDARRGVRHWGLDAHVEKRGEWVWRGIDGRSCHPRPIQSV